MSPRAIRSLAVCAGLAGFGGIFLTSGINVPDSDRAVPYIVSAVICLAGAVVFYLATRWERSEWLVKVDRQKQHPDISNIHQLPLAAEPAESTLARAVPDPLY